MKTILIIEGSPRKNGNSSSLAKAFAEAVPENFLVKTLSVADLNVAPCQGCNACFSNGNHCVQHDDIDKVYLAMAQADILILASPVYFYGISAQLAALINRLHNPIRDTFHIRQAALILTSASHRPQILEGIRLQFNMLLDNFHIENLGIIEAQGVSAPGDVLSTDYPQQVRQLAASLQ